MGRISSRTTACIKEVTAFTEFTYFERLFPLAGIFIAFSCSCIILRTLKLLFFCLLLICFSLWYSVRPHIMDNCLRPGWHRQCSLGRWCSQGNTEGRAWTNTCLSATSDWTVLRSDFSGLMIITEVMSGFWMALSYLLRSSSPPPRLFFFLRD